jgi:uncharacterized membrane protein
MQCGARSSSVERDDAGRRPVVGRGRELALGFDYPISGWLPMRRGLLAAMVVSLFAAGPALAHSLYGSASRPGDAADVTDLVQAALAKAAPGAQDASLAHSAVKATTYKAGTTAVNFAIFSYAAGGATGGATLALIALGASWTLYTVNDYLWDRFAPEPEKQETAEKFDANVDVWRNTKKFMTYKPAIAAFKYATVYTYTGSVMTTLVAGSATVLANTVVFYINNVAWDYYDWRNGRSARPVVAVP